MEGLSKMGEARTLKSPEAAERIRNLRKSFREDIYEAVDGLREVNTDLQKFNEVLESVGLQKLSQEELTAANAPKFEKIFEDMIAKVSELGSMTGFQKRDQLNRLSEGLEYLVPNMKNLYAPQLKELARRFELIGSNVAAENVGRMPGTLTQMSAMAGGITGAGVKYAREVMEAAPWIKKAADAAASGVKGAKRLHQILENAAGEGSSPEAIKYMIMQNPLYRDILGLTKEDLSGEDQND